MSFSYNRTAQELTVTITHGVRDVRTHYIKEISISKNGVPLLMQTYTTQPSPVLFSYTYHISGNDGDKLEVTATCNLYGALTASHILSGETKYTESNTAIPPLWPYHMGLLSAGFVCMAAGVVFARARDMKKGWFRAHSTLEKVGIGLIASGILVGIVMVVLSGGPHLRVPHAYVGAAAIALAGMGFSLGIGRKYIHKRKLLARKIHIRGGYLTLVIMLIAAGSGILLLGLF
jgi:hypothetical protein